MLCRSIFAASVVLTHASALAVDESSCISNQDPGCSDAPPVLLLQTQVDHVQHATVKDKLLVDISDSLSIRKIRSNLLNMLQLPYSTTCPQSSTAAMVQVYGKYMAISVFALIVVLGLGWDTYSQGRAAGERRLPQRAANHDVTSVTLQPILIRFLGAVFVMTMVNQTIVMPASEAKSSSAGQDTAFSGLLIGSYGIGIVASFPFFLYCSYHSYRLGMLFVGIVSILGNVLYAVSTSSWMIIFTRVVCGLEGGVIFMNQAIVQQLTQGDGLVKATAQVIMFPFVGLILGPMASTLCQNMAPLAPPEVPPAVFMSVCGVVFTIAVLLFFPNKEDCYAHAYSQGLRRRDDQIQLQAPPKVDDYDYKRSWLSVVLLSAVNLSRMTQRLFWETAALHLLAINYDYGLKQAASMMTTSLLGLVCLPLIVIPLKRKAGTIGGLRVMDLIEVVGILLLFRIPEMHFDHSGFFLLGSALFYVGNMGQFNFLVPLRAALAIPSIWPVSIEGGIFIYSLLQSVGVFLGPVAAREIQGTCDSQNVIPVFLLVTWTINMICKEVTVELLMNEDTDAKPADPAKKIKEDANSKPEQGEPPKKSH